MAFQEGGKQPRVLSIALHPFLVGHPFRARYLERALAHIRKHDSVWITHVTPTSEELSSSFGGADNPFEGGTTAMWECFSWMAYAYPNFGFNWNVAPIPAGPHGDIVSPTNADTFAISAHSKNPRQAWEVAKWLIEPEMLSRVCGILGCIPSRKSLGDAWLKDMSAQYPNVNFQLFLDSIQYMDASPNNEEWVPNYQKIWDATENAQDKLVSDETADPQAVMDALDTGDTRSDYHHLAADLFRPTRAG